MTRRASTVPDDLRRAFAGGRGRRGFTIPPADRDEVDRADEALVAALGNAPRFVEALRAWLVLHARLWNAQPAPALADVRRAMLGAPRDPEQARFARLARQGAVPNELPPFEMPDLPPVDDLPPMEMPDLEPLDPLPPLEDGDE